jgi:hypothetical protein
MMSTDTTALVPLDDIARMAAAIAKSNLFGIKTAEQAGALMIVAQAEGRHPGIVARDYHIIQGKPALKADAMLARFQEAGGSVQWHKYDHEAVEATFRHPAGGELRIAWTIDDAKRAGLLGSATWKQYPRAMLRARVISEGIRTIFPGVVAGTYTPEELGDFGAKPPPERDMGPAHRVDDPPKPQPQPQPQPISAAQHRRLEALLNEAALDRGRVKEAVAKRLPDRYPSAADVHLNEIEPDIAAWLESKIPQWRHRTALEALEPLKAAGTWDGQTDTLAALAERLEASAESAIERGERADRAADRKAERAEAARLQRLAQHARTAAELVAEPAP